ncbi:hypothetical protein JCM10207_005865, partial [Rhodosporidiobolus poonsookiae]
RSMTCYTCQ